MNEDGRGTISVRLVEWRHPNQGRGKRNLLALKKEDRQLPLKKRTGYHAAGTWNSLNSLWVVLKKKEEKGRVG